MASAELARKAARARWAGVSSSERSAVARKAAGARWGRGSTPEEIAGRAELAAKRETLRAAPCLNCGEPVGHARRKYCPKRECYLVRKARQIAAKRASDPTYGRTGYNEATAERYHRRRALKKGATAERFSHVEVFDRDDWTCGICAGPVDRDLRWPDPMSVSLDHIVPLALGGAHSRDNTQCSHLSCNVRKGAQAA